jgi:predicted nucleotidyltransferase
MAVSDIVQAPLRPGDTVTFEDRDDLLVKLDRLDRPVPARHEGRTRDDREHACMLAYLRFIGKADLLPLPVTLRENREGEDPPDFVLEWPDGRRERFEVTEGSTLAHQRWLSAMSASRAGRITPFDPGIPTQEAAEQWAEIVFSSFVRKSDVLVQGRFSVDHLLIYDLTGLRLLVPLETGAPILRRKLQEWLSHRAPRHRFSRTSVLRDLALLLDAGVEPPRILRGESPFFQLPPIWARDEEDLKRRLREIDRYCREHSIRHLKAFGSFLEDVVDLETQSLNIREDSDLDLLVEFEPGARVTLFDMARMERELTELVGIKVDLRTAGDLSRYFREKVLEEAVELPHAPRGRPAPTSTHARRRQDGVAHGEGAEPEGSR